MKNRIERTCDHDRGITAEEIRQGLAETKRRKAQPGYAEAEKRRIEKAKSEARARGIRFPSLAGTKPSIVTPLAARKQLLNHIR